MKAIRIHEFGGPEVLRLDEVPDLVPGPGEVLLRVRASALNHLDVDVRAGVSRFPIPLPHTMGYEVAGEIAALGPGVEGWAVGDRVLPYFASACGSCRFCRSGREALCGALQFIGFATPGGYAEQLTVGARQLIRLPDSLSFEQAAAIQAAFGTSWHMLFTQGKLRAGETVFISSVGSGIGSAAVQLAKLAGAFVIGTASSEAKLEQARGLGLDAGIDYTRQDVVEEVLRLTGGRGADLAYEHVGGGAFQTALDCLGKDGRMVVCGAHAGEIVRFDIIPFFRAQKSVTGSFCYTQAEVERCVDLAGRGLVRPQVFRAFPLAEAAEAHRTMERREHFGKIVLVP